MKRLIFILILILAPGLAFGATYNGVSYTEVFYLRTSGDASAPETVAGAWDLADVNTAGNWDTDDSDDGKLGPNDCLVVLDDDGSIVGMLTIQQSGLSGKQITIVGETGGTATIDADGANARAVYSSGKDYITIKDLIVANGTTANIGTAGITDSLIIDNVTSNGGVSSIYLLAGTGVQVKNCTINQGSQYGLLFLVSGSDYIINGVAENNAFVGAEGKTHTRAIYMTGVNITFSNNTISNWSQNNTVSDIIYVASTANGFTATNNTITNCDGRGFNIYSPATISGGSITNVTGIGIRSESPLTVSNISLTNCLGGIQITNSSGDDSSLSNIDIQDSTATGIYLGNAASGTMSNLTIDNSTSYGLRIASEATGNIILSDVTVSNSGATGFFLSGDGTYALNDCISNTNTTAGLITGGAGTYTLNNCTFKLTTGVMGLGQKTLQQQL